VEAWVLRQNQGERQRVTFAEIVMVAVDEHGKPRILPAA
jgi:acyl-CoA hydrolase